MDFYKSEIHSKVQAVRCQITELDKKKAVLSELLKKLEQHTGHITIGVYPLLENETCRFLTVDFDKKSWMEDVAAFAETCKKHSIPCAVEPCDKMLLQGPPSGQYLYY